MMTITRWIVRIHKWVALVVGLQVLAWVGGGLGMTLMPIEQVRAEHTIAPAPDYPLDPAALMSLAEVSDRLGGVRIDGAQLRRWHDGPVWALETSLGPVTVDAVTGARRTPVDRAAAVAIAQAGFAGDAAIGEVAYFSEPTFEYRRPNPAWRVSFEDGEGTRLYVNARTGEIDARRNAMWRVFDFFWMLHVMDYRERENFNHPLIISMAVLALLTVLAGLSLLVVRMRRTALATLRRRARDRGEG